MYIITMRTTNTGIDKKGVVNSRLILFQWLLRQFDISGYTNTHIANNEQLLDFFGIVRKLRQVDVYFGCLI